MQGVQEVACDTGDQISTAYGSLHKRLFQGADVQGVPVVEIPCRESVQM